MNPIMKWLARAIWRPVTARQLGLIAADYLQAEAAPKLGIAPGRVRLEPLPTGNNTPIWRWVTAERGSLYVRMWPWSHRRDRVAETAAVHTLMAQAGVTTPRIVFRDSTFPTLKRWRLQCVIESEAAGAPVDWSAPQSAGIVATAAGQLAQIHACVGLDWGMPWRPENELADPAAFWAARVKTLAGRITTDTSELTGDEIRDGLRLLEEMMRGIEWRAPALIHGDIQPAHVFATAEGRLTWIDFGTVQYSLPEQDLACVWLCFRERPELFDLFMEAYIGSGLVARTISPQAIQAFVFASYWEKLNSRVQRTLGRKKRGDNRGLEMLARQRRSVEALIRAWLHERRNVETISSK